MIYYSTYVYSLQTISHWTCTCFNRPIAIIQPFINDIRLQIFLYILFVLRFPNANGINISIYIYISIYLRFSIFCSHFSYVYWYLCKMIYYMIGLLYWWIWVESKPKLSDFCSILFRYVFLFSSTTWCNISSVLWTRSGVFVVIVICLILLYSVKMHRFAVIGWSETEFCFIFGTCSIVDKRKSWKCRWNKYYLYIYLWFTQQDKKPNKTELGIVCFERLYVMTHTASLNSQWTVRRIEKSKI